MSQGERQRRPRFTDAADLETLKRKCYQFDPLTGYSFRERFLIRTADLLLAFLIRIVCSTLRWEVEGLQNLDSILSNGNRAIFTFWHSNIFTATWFWRDRGIVVMSSKSRDGEYTGRLIKRFGYGAARGSSNRGAGRALAEMANCLNNGIDVAFTIDGPRGPRFIAKTGAVTLARHSGQAILPFHIEPTRFMELPTWDRMRIPWMFSRVRVGIAPPIYIAHDAPDELIQSKQAELQASLDALQNQLGAV